MNNFNIGDLVTLRAGEAGASAEMVRDLKTPLKVVRHCGTILTVQGSCGHLAEAFANRFVPLNIEAVLKANAHLGLIEQIKGFRAATGAGLKESKDAVEAFRAPRQTLGDILKQGQEIRQSPTTNRTTVRVRQQVKHWIIAVLDKKTDMPLPATNPRTYGSAEQARRVAYEMAEKNRSETFVVYEATDVVVAPPVTLPETQHVKL